MATRLELWEKEWLGRLCTYALDNDQQLAVMPTVVNKRFTVLHKFILMNVCKTQCTLGDAYFLE